MIPQPTVGASHAAWMAFSISLGMPREEAAALTCDQLRLRFSNSAHDRDAAPDVERLRGSDGGGR